MKLRPRRPPPQMIRLPLPRPAQSRSRSRSQPPKTRDEAIRFWLLTFSEAIFPFNYFSSWILNCRQKTKRSFFSWN